MASLRDYWYYIFYRYFWPCYMYCPCLCCYVCGLLCGSFSLLIYISVLSLEIQLLRGGELW